MIAAAFILQDKPVRFSCGNFYKEDKGNIRSP